eukprot:SAG31_NODE_2160_length_6297_cov_4.924015_3_plen_170_part_00
MSSCSPRRRPFRIMIMPVLPDYNSRILCKFSYSCTAWRRLDLNLVLVFEYDSMVIIKIQTPRLVTGAADWHCARVQLTWERGARGAAVGVMLTSVVAYLPTSTIQLPVASMPSASVAKITVLRGTGYGGQHVAHVGCFQIDAKRLFSSLTPEADVIHNATCRCQRHGLK